MTRFTQRQQITLIMRATIAQCDAVVHLGGLDYSTSISAISTQRMRTQMQRTNPLPSTIIPTTSGATTSLVLRLL